MFTLNWHFASQSRSLGVPVVMRCEFLSRLQSSSACRIAVTTALIGTALALGACSSARQAQNQPTSWAGANPLAPAPQQSTYVAEPGDPIKEPPVEPRSRPNAAPDDPNEPFSPNYGGARTRAPVRVSDAAPATKESDEPAPAIRHLPDASRAYFRRTTTAAAD